jgi:hypothetical protein
MTQEEFSIKDKIDILKHAEVMQRGELASRREEQRKVFTWSSTILLTLIGALLIVKQSESVIWGPYGLWGKTLASLTVAVLVFFSIRWQDKHYRYYKQGAEVLVRIETLLHYFDEGFFDSSKKETLLLAEWANWGKPSANTRRVFATNEIGATWFLGVLAAVVIWLT